MRIARVLTCVGAVATVAALVACAPPGPSVDDQIKSAVKDATELRIERIPMVELKFKKDEFTLDIERHLDNEMAAETVELPVGTTTYNKWQEGQELSRDGMAANIILKGEISEYVVTVNKKWIETHWLYLDKANKPHEISEEAYKGALQKLPHDKLQTVETVNSVMTFVLDKPVGQPQFTSVKPFTRYFVTVEIGNETFSFDIDKQLRDAFSKHQIELEVSKQTYDGGEVWDSHLSSYTFFTKGRWQEIHGHIINRRTVADPKFMEATLPSGRVVIVPTEQVK